MKHIHFLSYDKDSLYSLILAKRLGVPIDAAVYVDIRFNKKISGEHPKKAAWIPYAREILRRDYGIDDFGNFISCQGSVPQALVCFLESDGFEDAVRNAVSLGGDTDTQGAITGSVAEAYYGLPDGMEEKAEHYLTDDLAAVCHAFRTIRRPRVPRLL